MLDLMLKPSNLYCRALAVLYTKFYCYIIYPAEAEKNNKANDGAARSEPRAGRVLSLSDILYRSEANSDASQDGPRSEREDSDYDEEVEVDFETSISGDEGRDVEANVLHGSLNLRIHRRGDLTRETGSANGSCGSPSSSSQNDKIPYQVLIHELENRNICTHKNMKVYI